jgi:AraC-like DNA-binding protein
LRLRSTKAPAVVVYTMLLAALWGRRSGASAAPAETVVSRTDRVISVDGDLGEWAAAATIELASGFGRGPRDNESMVKLLWDARCLYVAFVVFDTEINARSPAEETETWLDDGVEVFVDSRHNASEVARMGAAEYERLGGSYEAHSGVREYLDDDDYHLIVNVRGTLSLFRGSGLRKMGGRWTGDIRSALAMKGTVDRSDDVDTQYTVEIAIPWQTMGIRPEPGLRLGADFAVNDIDPDGRFPTDWSGVRPFNRPDKWGDIVLGGTFRGGKGPAGPFQAVAAALALVAAALTALAWQRGRRPPAGAAATAPASSGVDADYAARVEDYISTHYSIDEISVRSAAKHLHISTRYLQLILKRSGRPGFSDMLTEARLRKAEELLRTTSMPVGEVCYAVGFTRPDAFATRFRRRTGLSPTEFRKSSPDT